MCGESVGGWFAHPCTELHGYVCKRLTASVMEVPREPHYLGACPNNWFYFGHKVRPHKSSDSDKSCWKAVIEPQFPPKNIDPIDRGLLQTCDNFLQKYFVFFPCSNEHLGHLCLCQTLQGIMNTLASFMCLSLITSKNHWWVCFEQLDVSRLLGPTGDKTVSFSN